MKTTIDIADDLFQRGKRVAKKDNVTFKTLVEEGLVQVLEQREHAKAKRLRLPTFKGRGMNPEFEIGGWPAIRAAIYEGRGG